MSYILDALRKAERDRQVTRVPTLAAAHGSAELARRLHWGWLAATGAVSLSAIALYGLLLAPGRPGSAPVPVVIGSPTAASDPATRPGAATPGSTPSVERAPMPVEAAPDRAPEPTVARPPGGRGVARGRAAATAPTVEAPPSARTTLDPRPAQEPAKVVGPGRSGVAPAPVPEARPTAEVAIPPALVPTPPPPDAGAARAVPPVPPEPADVQGRLALDVLVYSEIPAERLVFINGRKYVEGQAVDTETVIQQITPEGAVLIQQGRQIVLRPKLNPYTRSGSP